jgi:hypothetical protein
VRKGVKALKALSVFLMLVVVAMYAVALWLARGWRREALLRMGFGVLIVGLIIEVVRNVVGSALIDSLVGNSKPTVKPAATASWLILTQLLDAIGWTAIIFGIVAIVLAFLAGPTGLARMVRRWIAPGLVRHPWIAWSVVALILVIVFVTVPIVDVTKLITRLVLVALLVGGVEMLRRVTKAEHPDGGWTWGTDEPAAPPGQIEPPGP